MFYFQFSFWVNFFLSHLSVWYVLRILVSHGIKLKKWAYSLTYRDFGFTFVFKFNSMLVVLLHLFMTRFTLIQIKKDIRMVDLGAGRNDCKMVVNHMFSLLQHNSLTDSVSKISMENFLLNYYLSHGFRFKDENNFIIDCEIIIFFRNYCCFN